MSSKVKKSICSDAYRYYGDSSLRARIKTYIFQGAYKYTKIYRRVNYYYKRNKKIRYFLMRLLLLRRSYKYGYQINEKAQIGEGLYLGHRGTIIINGDAVLGNNVNIQAGVTIGQENRGERIGAPHIGNEVWIGGNAVIVGKITIGNNVLIAPNSFVNRDIPDDSIVVGNPIRIIHNEEATVGYIQNKVDI